MNEQHNKAELSLQSAFEKLKVSRENLAPEKQYVISLVAVWLYLTILVNPGGMPKELDSVLEYFDKMPLSSLSLWLSTTAAFVGAVDGARRIALEQLPFYKAYLQVFVLQRF